MRVMVLRQLITTAELGRFFLTELYPSSRELLTEP